MERRILSAKQEKNVLTSHQEFKERVDPMIQIKVLLSDQYAYKKAHMEHVADQQKLDIEMRRMQNISKPKRRSEIISKESHLARTAAETR